MKKEKKINESLIGKIIYGFLMFAPLLAIMFTSLYATFNPNAKDSYSGTQTQYEISYQYETNEVNSVDDLIVGNIYKFTFDYSVLTSNSQLFTSYGLFALDNPTTRIVTSDNFLLCNYIVTSNAIIIYLNGTTMQSTIYDINQQNFFLYIVYRDIINQNITYQNFTASDYLGEPIIEETEVEGTLDNAFYYALDKTEDSTLFNWSKNTAIYTVLHNACNGVGITTTFIPFILTYWLLISLVYLIYDLVLVFVHIAHKKVHELEDF